MSKKILKKKFQDDYSNVYEKGALLAFLLDIRINELTDGKKSLKSVLMDMTEKYGPDKPFKDNDFIDEFVEASHPEIKTFFKKYIKGRKKLPYEEYFAKIGWEFLEDEDIPTFSFGFDRGSLAVAEGTEFLVFVDTTENPLGLKKGDVLINIEGQRVTTEQIDPLFYLYFVDDNTPLTVDIMRNGEEITVSGPPKEGTTHVDYFVRRLKNETDEMKALRKDVLHLED